MLYDNSLVRTEPKEFTAVSLLLHVIVPVGGHDLENAGCCMIIVWFVQNPKNSHHELYCYMLLYMWVGA